MDIIYELVLEPDYQSNENYLNEYPDDPEAQAEFQEQFEAGSVGFVLIYTRVTVQDKDNTYSFESDACGGCMVPFKDGKPAPECFELGSSTNAFIVDIAQENHPDLTSHSVEIEQNVAKFPIVLEGF